MLQTMLLFSLLFEAHRMWKGYATITETKVFIREEVERTKGIEDPADKSEATLAYLNSPGVSTYLIGNLFELVTMLCCLIFAFTATMGPILTIFLLSFLATQFYKNEEVSEGAKVGAFYLDHCACIALYSIAIRALY